MQRYDLFRGYDIIKRRERGDDMNSIRDCYTLSNGMEIPCIGYGTFKVQLGEETGTDVVLRAIKAGYRYFDTASLYETEADLGQAIIESGIPREEFFIVTKLWFDEMGYENTKKACEDSLRRLQMDYVDIYLIHWPRANETDDNWKEINIETWKAMEELVDEGKTKAIGLSNFLPQHIENLLPHCRIKPVVNQLEIHPGYSQEAAVEYCKEKEIQVQAWSPLGRNSILQDPYFISLGKKYEVSVAQICLRFLLQKGIIPLPKATSYERMVENQALFSFEISQEDMYRIATMPQTLWLGEHPDFAVPKKFTKKN